MTADPTLVLAILMAFAFALTNGFHDAANSIATLVATRVARPLPAVALASVFNLLGPLFFGAAVANTVGKLVTVDPEHAVAVIGAGLTGAVVWNLSPGVGTCRPARVTRSSVGSSVRRSSIGCRDDRLGPVQDGHLVGVLGVLVGILVATVPGFAVAFVLERLAAPRDPPGLGAVRGPVRSGQWATSAWLAFSHGSNDAQKTVGIVAGLLLAGGKPRASAAPLPVVAGASVALTLGTALGGWGIVKTIGRRIFPIRQPRRAGQPVVVGRVIFIASFVGAPVSTTQVVSTSIVGIGVGRARWRHVSWAVVREIAVAWLTTMPAAGLIAALTLPIWRSLPGGDPMPAQMGWFLPENPDVLGMLRQQAAVTIEGMAALVEWADGDADGQRPRPRRRAPGGRRQAELRAHLKTAFITPIGAEDLFVMSGPPRRRPERGEGRGPRVGGDGRPAGRGRGRDGRPPGRGRPPPRRGVPPPRARRTNGDGAGAHRRRRRCGQGPAPARAGLPPGDVRAARGTTCAR